MRHSFYIVLGILLFASPAIWSSEKVVTTESLLKEMVNRNSLPQYPAPYYTCKQFSSYDRGTVAPGDNSWFANWDRSMFIRVDSLNGKKEYVMMETDEPGAIVRFWMTFAGADSGKGILRIYFDHNPKPAIEGQAVDIISGGQVVGTPLSTSVSDLTKYSMRGHNLYMPLPYSKHCKVTYESSNIKDFGAKTGGESVYYNINYRSYQPGTKVVTYSNKELKKNQTLLASVQKQLQHREVVLPKSAETVSLKGDILPGQDMTRKIEENNAAIRKLTFRIKAPNREQALRSTILTIRFDGHCTVQCPIGDFFGTGYQISPLNTWYAHVDAEGMMSCFWVMPYREKCEVTLENRGMQTVTVQTGDVTTAPYPWDDNTMYFSSAWKQFTRLETGEFKSNEGDGGPFDINYVTLKGKGVYAGDGLTLFNTVDAWWGEGDEKVYVDGESFPSHIGTGTEDYYGYAWCRPERFSNHPFIAQPDGSGNFHPGYTVNLRYRSLDAIPFSRSLRFDMEMWHWVKATINFAPVTYWYIHPQDVAPTPSQLKDAQEPVALKVEDLSVPDQWYKGNTHTHTTYSDGNTSVKEAIQWYKDHNYNFLFITDHNYPLNPDSVWNQYVPYFLLIPGNEISDVRAIHSSALNTTAPLSVVGKKSDSTAEVLSKHWEAITQGGGVPVLNHPNFLSGVQVSDVLSTKGLKHLEVFNGHPSVFNNGNEMHAPVEAKWDSLLANRRLFFGLASDDTHNFKEWNKNKANPGRGWIMVKAKHLATENIMQAIRTGNFYASTGVILSRHDYNPIEKSITIEVNSYQTRMELGLKDNEPLPETVIQFLGNSGKVLHEAKGLRATYAGKEADRYMRVRVTCSSNGETYFAWGQPVELENNYFIN